jgi:hypothetical protein
MKRVLVQILAWYGFMSLGAVLGVLTVILWAAWWVQRDK